MAETAVQVTLSLPAAKQARALLRANYREEGKHRDPESAKDCRICREEEDAIEALSVAIALGERDV